MASFGLIFSGGIPRNVVLLSENLYQGSAVLGKCKALVVQFWDDDE